MIDVAELVRAFAGHATTTPNASTIGSPLPCRLDRDRDAVRTAVTLSFHSGGTEGVNTKTKRSMRLMHGQAGFTLLRHLILLA